MAMSEPDKIELTEDKFKEWCDSDGPVLYRDEVRQLINALRTARQELLASEKELEIRTQSCKVAFERIAELEQQLANAGEIELRHIIEELEPYTIDCESARMRIESLLAHKDAAYFNWKQCLDTIDELKAQSQRDRERIAELEIALEAHEKSLETLHLELRRLSEVAQTPLSTVGSLLRRVERQSAALAKEPSDV